MKKLLLLASLLTIEHSALAACSSSKLNWKMHITNKTPYTITLDCGADITSGGTGTGSGTANATCGYSVSSSQCSYHVNGRTGTLMLSYNSCTSLGASVSASVSTADKYPLPFACHVAPKGTWTGQRMNGACPTFHPPTGPYYYTYSVESYFTISENTNYNTVVWKNVVTNLVKGQVMANKLARSLLNTENYANVTGHYDGQNITIKASGGVPTDPYTSDTSCN